MVVVFRTVPVPVPVPVAVAAGAGELAPASTSPNSTSAATARPAAVSPAALVTAGGIWAGNRAGAAAGPSAGACAAAGASASAARTTKASTSTTPATMPAVVRTSLNPNSPVQTDKRYPPRVARAKPAPAAAASRLATTSRLGMTSTASPRPKAAITCSRNSHPIVGIVRYPVRYRSRWIAAVAIRRPEPATRRITAAQAGAVRPACSRAARPAPLAVVSLVMSCRSVICQSSVSAGSVSVASAARRRAGGRGGCGAGGGDFVPHTAVLVQAVALGLAGGGVGGEGVQRGPVEGRLGRPVGALDGAEGALDPGCGGRPLHRRPELRARPVAVGLGGRVGGERVQREPLSVGQHRRAADRGGLQVARSRRGGGAGAGAAAAASRGCAG